MYVIVSHQKFVGLLTVFESVITAVPAVPVGVQEGVAVEVSMGMYVIVTVMLGVAAGGVIVTVYVMVGVAEDVAVCVNAGVAVMVLLGVTCAVGVPVTPPQVIFTCAELEIAGSLSPNIVAWLACGTSATGQPGSAAIAQYFTCPHCPAGTAPIAASNVLAPAL